MRKATIKRKTKETDIAVTVSLDGTGKASIDSGIGFFDHMLEQLARHSLIDLTVKAKGDLHIDQHQLLKHVHPLELLEQQWGIGQLRNPTMQARVGNQHFRTFSRSSTAQAIDFFSLL